VTTWHKLTDGNGVHAGRVAVAVAVVVVHAAVAARPHVNNTLSISALKTVLGFL